MFWVFVFLFEAFTLDLLCWVCSVIDSHTRQIGHDLEQIDQIDQIDHDLDHRPEQIR